MSWHSLRLTMKMMFGLDIFLIRSSQLLAVNVKVIKEFYYYTGGNREVSARQVRILFLLHSWKGYTWLQWEYNGFLLSPMRKQLVNFSWQWSITCGPPQAQGSCILKVGPRKRLIWTTSFAKCQDNVYMLHSCNIDTRTVSGSLEGIDHCTNGLLKQPMLWLAQLIGNSYAMLLFTSQRFLMSWYD